MSAFVISRSGRQKKKNLGTPLRFEKIYPLIKTFEATLK